MPYDRLSPALRPLLAPALFLVLASVPACSDDGESTGPPPSSVPENLVGTWEAATLEVIDQEDPSKSTDVVTELGGTFLLELRGDGHYEAALEFQDQSQTERGTVEVVEDQLNFQPQEGQTPTPSSLTWSLFGQTMVLQGETRFDVDQDGAEEEVSLRIEMHRL